MSMHLRDTRLLIEAGRGWGILRNQMAHVSSAKMYGRIIQKLSKSVGNKSEPREAIFCLVIKPKGLRRMINSAGSNTYIVYYLTGDVDPLRRMTMGRHDSVTPDEVRMVL